MNDISGLILLIGVCFLVFSISAIPFIIAWYFGVLTYFTLFVVAVVITAWIVSKRSE